MTGGEGVPVGMGFGGLGGAGWMSRRLCLGLVGSGCEDGCRAGLVTWWVSRRLRLGLVGAGCEDGRMCRLGGDSSGVSLGFSPDDLEFPICFNFDYIRLG